MIRSQFQSAKQTIYPEEQVTTEFIHYQLARIKWGAFAVVKDIAERNSEVCFIWTKHI